MITTCTYKVLNRNQKLLQIVVAILNLFFEKKKLAASAINVAEAIQSMLADPQYSTNADAAHDPVRGILYQRL